jgi:hypothetical protein
MPNCPEGAGIQGACLEPTRCICLSTGRWTMFGCLLAADAAGVMALLKKVQCFHLRNACKRGYS